MQRTVVLSRASLENLTYVLLPSYLAHCAILLNALVAFSPHILAPGSPVTANQTICHLVLAKSGRRLFLTYLIRILYGEVEKQRTLYV